MVSSSLREGGTFVPLSSIGVAALIHPTMPVFPIIVVKNCRRFSKNSSVQVPIHPNQYSHFSWRMTSALRLIRAPECASFNNFYS